NTPPPAITHTRVKQAPRLMKEVSYPSPLSEEPVAEARPPRRKGRGVPPVQPALEVGLRLGLGLDEGRVRGEVVEHQQGSPGADGHVDGRQRRLDLLGRDRLPAGGRLGRFGGTPG
ncbi:unnamed protein product, partial [Ectocarpus fasciculatus]